MNGIILAPVPELLSVPLFYQTPNAARRVLEFLTAEVNNDDTRKACLKVTRRFAT